MDTDADPEKDIESPSFVYVITSYRSPKQIYRLARVVRSQSRGRIIVSHDCKGPDLDADLLSEHDVLLRRTSRPIHWGDGSYFASILDLLEQENREGSHKWFTILTSADYPLRPLRDYEAHLSTSHADALLEPVGSGPSYEFLLDRYRRYAVAGPSWAGKYPWLPLLRRSVGRLPGVQVSPRPHGLGPFLSVPRRTPFGGDLRLYKGCDLFAANDAAVRALISARDTLWRYFRRTAIPSEAFPHTVLWNDVNVRVRSEMIHYAVWRNSAHPDMIDRRDLQDALKSGRWFARKFSADSPLLDEIDTLLSDPS